MVAAADELLRLGVVTGTHGLRGDLKVHPITDEPSALLAAREVCLRGRQGELIPCRVAAVKAHKGSVLLRLQGFENIDAAQTMVGCEVLMPRGELPALTDDEFYWFELEGLSVVDRRRGNLGVLEEMFSTAAHDIYVVRGRYGEVLIPAVKEFIVEIDRDGRRMLVDLPDGLVPEKDEI
ncbi:MAG TPA: ribosome maturation factor RimM [Desulfuromonadales bacterium]|nr:ribosome maturation factor RimM [Desulfuromonadales bacterium]